jgi:hypothetical protein
MGYPKPGYEPEVIQEAVIAAPTPKLTVMQRAAKATTPDMAIRILKKAPMGAKIKAALKAAYVEKLDVDLAKGNNKGAAIALVYLAKLEANGRSKAVQIAALKKFVRASTADSSNSEALSGMATLRKGLKGYADTRHKEAVSFFVSQDFAAAARIWETVLLIDPSNSAASNWYEESKSVLNR